MKSKKAKELMKWLESSTRPIDLPRDYSNIEIQKLIEISETELTGDTELLEKQISEFKKLYEYKI